jgi:hypothetical protein
MRVEDILLAMENRPRPANRRNREFVESVSWELNKRGGIEADIQRCRDFVLMAVIKGVYIDADIGTLDTIGYITNAVVFKYTTSVPQVDFAGFRDKIVEGVDELTAFADNSLFVAGFAPNIARRDGLARDFFVFSGKKSYWIASRLAKCNAHHTRFHELSDNFEDYADALLHTSSEYFSN